MANRNDVHSAELIRKAYDGDLTGVKKLVELSFVDINFQDEQGHTALMRARNPKILKLLIRQGADINLVDKNGDSALIWAQRKKNGNPPKQTKMLLKAGANAFIRNNRGETALDITENNMAKRILQKHIDNKLLCNASVYILSIAGALFKYYAKAMVQKMKHPFFKRAEVQQRGN